MKDIGINILIIWDFNNFRFFILIAGHECDGNVIPITPDKKLVRIVVEQFKNMLD
jgi:hypothetical protein